MAWTQCILAGRQPLQPCSVTNEGKETRVDGLEMPNDADYIELDQLQVRPQGDLHAAKAQHR